MITWTDLLFAVYIAVPAYLANSLPAVSRGGGPIDRGYLFVDGERILGTNKTFKGFAFGLFGGLLASIAMEFFLERGLFILGSLASLGALLGDLLGAFIKRRLKMEPGAPFPVLDQLDFILGALLLTYPVHQAKVGTAIILGLFTPPAHLLANFIAYHLGVKKYWW
jgi:CDP-2,3-bis-(O-geranylgeranyl)-sn-glycerol synthase